MKELHKPVIRKFKKWKVYNSSKDNMWGAHFADMQLISKFNKGIRFLLCILDIFSNFFQKILDKSGRKPNKIWVDKGSEFGNISMKSWLQDHNIETYSTDNEKKICCCRKIKVNSI